MAYSRSNNIFPYFKAGRNSDILLSTNSGVGAAAGFPFNAISISGGGGVGYSTSTYEYTVPVTGLYLFTANLNMENQSAIGDDSVEWGFNVTTSSGSYTYYSTIINPGFWSETSVRWSMTLTKIIKMDAGHKIKVYMSNKDEEERYFGAAENLDFNFFYGFLISAEFG